MQDIFYNHPYIPTLKEFITLAPDFDRESIINFYNNQEIVQIHKKPPEKSKLRNHFQISVPHERHELDLLFLPTDKGNKYCLTVIDCASRYKFAEPVKNKTANTVLEAYKRIMSRKFYEKPRTCVADDGSEFKGVFREFMRSSNIEFSQNKTGHHTSFAERFNGALSVQIFKMQQQQELTTGKVSRIWVDALQDIIDGMNRKVTRLIKMAPIDAVVLAHVKQPSNDYGKLDAEKHLPIGTVVRYLLSKDEIQNTYDKAISIERRRLTDPTYSGDKYRVVKLRKACSDCLFYHYIEPISAGKSIDRGFTYWQLQIVE